MLRILSGTVFILLGVLPGHVVFAQGLSANLGFNSEYIYRGIPQKTSSAFGGLDYEHGGFSVGTWVADVGDGAEIDYYGGYAFEAGEFGFSVGGTWYTYTGAFDDEYLELNLAASWKFFSLHFADGKYANFGGPEMDYLFYSLTFEHGGFYGKAGRFGGDFDGAYFEAGYGNSINFRGQDLLDYSVALIQSDSTLLGGASETNMVLTVSRSFSLD
jgi:uncharacterized protein (TIGR02001 family)